MRAQGTGVPKEPVLERLFDAKVSAAAKYRQVFVGRGGWGAFAQFEVVTVLCGSMPGALGFWLRKHSYPRLLARAGAGALWGRGIGLRHPWKITLGDRVVIDDGCLLDARGAGEEGLRIGSDVLIARDTIIQAKAGGVVIGDRCTIGSQTQLTSVAGIRIGNDVMIAGQCYLGGGRYHTDDPATPMHAQGLYAKGPIVIEDDVWVGAGVIVQDGVRIGTGSVLGAGSVIREDVPAMTVVAPHQKLLLLPRTSTSAAHSTQHTAHNVVE